LESRKQEKQPHKISWKNPYAQYAISHQKHSSSQTNYEEKEKELPPHPPSHLLYHSPKQVDFSP